MSPPKKAQKILLASPRGFCAGVAKVVPAAACRRRLLHVDATCPLVSKVVFKLPRALVA